MGHFMARAGGGPHCTARSQSDSVIQLKWRLWAVVFLHMQEEPIALFLLHPLFSR